MSCLTGGRRLLFLPCSSMSSAITAGGKPWRPLLELNSSSSRQRCASHRNAPRARQSVQDVRILRGQGTNRSRRIERQQEADRFSRQIRCGRRGLAHICAATRAGPSRAAHPYNGSFIGQPGLRYCWPILAALTDRRQRLQQKDKRCAGAHRRPRAGLRVQVASHRGRAALLQTRAQCGSDQRRCSQLLVGCACIEPAISSILVASRPNGPRRA